MSSTPNDFGGVDPSRPVSTIVGTRDPSINDGSAEEHRENEHHVDVKKAKEEFAQLERRLSRAQSLVSRNADAAEKGIPFDQDPDHFDLREYLSSSHEAETQHGIRHKHVGVTWDNLSVEVMAGGDGKFYAPGIIPTILGTLLTPVQLPLGLLQSVLPSKNEMPTRAILNNFNGLLKPGEMCLVLGKPESGCTTFLKAIANDRGDYFRVSGDVKYAGIDHEEMRKRYGGEVVYNREDDLHIATLTVEQTMEFALSTKTPGKRLPGMSGKEFNTELMNTLLKMLNITHTKKTKVGDEFVRGVSGGERKRVSIIEMMATRAHVVAYDNSTRGLDASTALDFAKSLRVTTDVLGQTTFVSLYQAGEGIYDLFDKVLVIDKGRTVYFGPAKTARQYFVGLGFKDMPRQATADFLTACTDPNERQIAPKVDPQSVPYTSEELQEAYEASSFYTDMIKEREEYKRVMESENNHDQEEFRLAVLDAKKKGVSKKSPYTLGFYGQVKALTTRQFRLQLQDSFTLWTSFSISWASAIILGATFRNLPLTTSGGFTRGSVMFVSMLVNCLDAFAELGVQHMGRPITQKQVGYRMFRPAAFSLANTIADLPFSAIRLLVFDIVVYFMANLHRSAGAFFTFHLFIYLAFLTLQGFFRILGVITPNFSVAFRIGTFVVPFMITYAGYLIPVDSMQRWLFWIYYINPMAYSFNGLMENEFGKIDMLCDGNYIIPRNAPGQQVYPEGLGPNQVCTFYGAQGGNPIVTGSDYIDVGFMLDVDDLWKMNFVILLVLFFVFQAIQLLTMEYIKHPSMAGITVYIKETEETHALNQRLKERKEATGDSKEKEEEFKTTGKSLIWRDVNYTVPVPGGTRRLLHDVSGYVKPGTLTALMGASGAGKTTALDVLAQRKNIGVVTGTVLLDGKPLTLSFGRETAYAEQMDVHELTATVREAMRFSAYLRQPFEISEAEKNDYVESIIELLELQELADALVASLSVEARKRLTIGVELASRPAALLFLDEPTSGLDAQSAFNLVRFLRKLAVAGQAILCTIHQPSALLFEQFDRLLLLERGGETVYFGDIGKDSVSIREYFAKNGAVCPDDVNPAEFMLEAIGAGSSKRIGPRDWHDIWVDSPEYERTLREIERIIDDGKKRPETNTGKPQKYATPFLYQLKVVMSRANLALWRNPDYVWTRLWMHIQIGLIISLTFLQLGHSQRDLQFRVFAIFWWSVLPAIIANQIQPMFIFNRMTFIREASSGMYSAYVFAIGQLIGETPYTVASAILWWVLTYFPMNFGEGQGGKGGSGYFLLMTIFLEMYGVSLAQAIAALSPSIKIALLINPPLTLIVTTFAGVTIPYPNLGKFWKWLYQLNPVTRLIAGLTVVELQGFSVECKADELVSFSPPNGETCAQWAGTFVDTFGGYLVNGNATDTCQYCAYKTGEEFFTPLNMSYHNRWRDLWLIVAYFSFNMAVTIVASRYLRFAKR